MTDPAPPDVLASALVRWYRANARDLPWRRAPTPYATLLSELMLQQTRVDTVIERFEAFLARWPTLADLAAATEEQVVEAWAGLGYYSRARNLHRAAVAAHAAGGLPSSPDALRELPGVGPYTAGAIASIAFGVAAPLVDGNVERVLSRVDGRTADPRSAEGKKALWARAEALVQHAPPSDLNQGLMELGALVCTPKSPDCRRCPWSGPCVARAGGDPERLPVLAPRKKPTPVYAVAGLLWRDERVLMGRRPPGGLLAGLWEPVGTAFTEDRPGPEALLEAFRERTGREVTLGARLGSLVHVFSHRRLTMEVYEVTGGERAGDPSGHYPEVAWQPPDRPTGLSTLARKTLALGAEPQLSLLAADRRGETA